MPTQRGCGGKQVRVTRRADMGRRKGGLHGGTTLPWRRSSSTNRKSRLVCCFAACRTTSTPPGRSRSAIQYCRRWRRRFALWCGHHHIVIVIALVDAEAARGLIRSLIAVCDSSVSSSLCAASTLLSHAFSRCSSKATRACSERSASFSASNSLSSAGRSSSTADEETTCVGGAGGGEGLVDAGGTGRETGGER